MNIRYRDVLIPLALVLAGGETEGGKHYLIGLEETLSKVAKHGGYNAVGDSSGLVVVAVPTAKLLKTELAFLGLVTGGSGVGLDFVTSHYTKS